MTCHSLGILGSMWASHGNTSICLGGICWQHRMQDKFPTRSEGLGQGCFSKVSTTYSEAGPSLLRRGCTALPGPQPGKPVRASLPEPHSAPMLLC